MWTTPYLSPCNTSCSPPRTLVRSTYWFASRWGPSHHTIWPHPNVARLTLKAWHCILCLADAMRCWAQFSSLLMFLCHCSVLKLTDVLVPLFSSPAYWCSCDTARTIGVPLWLLPHTITTSVLHDSPHPIITSTLHIHLTQSPLNLACFTSPNHVYLTQSCFSSRNHVSLHSIMFYLVRDNGQR